MTFASNAEADPDPTTQMTWPSSRRSVSGSQVFKSNYPGGQVESPQVERGPLRLDTTSNFKTLVGPGPGRRLTTKDLICLSISMAGAQIAWTVELGCVLRICPVSRSLRRPCPLMLRYISGMFTDFAGRYGTPFLLSLGVSEQLTSLVWLAGPISGLIAQPLIGASIFPPIQLSPPLAIFVPSFLNHQQNFLDNRLNLPFSRSLVEFSQSTFILTRFLYSIITQ